MYTYSTIPELIELLDKYWENNETFTLHYKHDKKYDLIEFTLLQNGNILYEFVCSVDNIRFPLRIWKTLEELPELKMFLDKMYAYKYKVLKQEIRTGNDIILGSHIMVSDPCYDTTTWCNGDLHDVHPGTWHTKALYQNDLCTDLVVWHSDIKEPSFDQFKKTDIIVGVDSGQAGIYNYNHFAKMCRNEQWYKSMCSVTHSETIPLTPLEQRCHHELKQLFPNGETESPELLVQFFELRPEFNIKYGIDIIHFKVHPNSCKTGYKDVLATDTHSVVSHAGYGDGSYDCYVAYNNLDEIIAIRINYITPEELKDDY